MESKLSDYGHGEECLGEELFQQHVRKCQKVRKYLLVLFKCLWYDIGSECEAKTDNGVNLMEVILIIMDYYYQVIIIY